MRTAVDAMGGDYAPDEIVKGIIMAASEYAEDQFILVGDKKRIENVLKGCKCGNIEIFHTDEYITMDDNPINAIKTKKMASMRIAAECIKNEKCDAMISAGNTGALLQAGLFHIGRIKGIKRPALVTFLPTKKENCVLLDAGANADCKPEHLVQFAYMGSIFLKLVKGMESPRVGLLNIGEEAGKGNAFYRQVYEELGRRQGINFTGNIESRALMNGSVDVAVADGFVGNMALKSLEAAAEFMQFVLKEEIKKSVVAKVAAMTMKHIFKNIRKRLDHSEYGGALLLGLNGILVKSHGRADSYTIRSAFRLTKKMYEQKVTESIREMASSVIL